MYHYWFLDLNPGWNGWLFSVALIIAIAALVLFRSWGRLVYSLVLYLGVFWLTWKWVGVAFWVVVGVTALGLLVYALKRELVGRWRHVPYVAQIASWVAFGLVTAMLVFSALGSLLNYNWGNPPQNFMTTAPPSAASPSPSASPYTQRSASQCVGGFNVVWDQNGGNRDVTSGIDTSNPTVARTQILAVAHHDTRYLFKLVMASPMRAAFPTLKQESQLRGTGTDNGCYSALGRDVYNSLQGYWYNGSKVKFTSTTAPTYGSNSGTKHNGSTFMEQPGTLTGDRRAVQVTYLENKQVVYVLHRCGNVFVPGKTPVPNVPVQPTPPPSHVPTPPPPPGVQCKPGQWWNGHMCLTPKDPSKDPQSQGNVPSQAVKHSPSTDNSYEVSQPASSPTDSGNGIPSGSTSRVTPASGTTSAPPTHASGPPVPQPTSSPTTATPVSSSPTASGTIAPPPP